MLTKDEAICISAIDYSETSQIVTFFSRATGKISTIAKGSKRPKSPFDGPIEILSHGKIVFSYRTDRKLATLTEFGQRFTQYDTNLFVLNCSVFAAELVNKLTDEYDPHPQLFDHLLQFLKNVKEHERTLLLLILFQLALLREVGLQPILKFCVNCKNNYSTNWPRSYFSSSANGLICRDCQAGFPDGIRLTVPAANCLADLNKLADAEEKILNEIERVLIYHFTETLGYPPKMAKHILSRDL